MTPKKFELNCGGVNLELVGLLISAPAFRVNLSALHLAALSLAKEGTNLFKNFCRSNKLPEIARKSSNAILKYIWKPSRIPFPQVFSLKLD